MRRCPAWWTIAPGDAPRSTPGWLPGALLVAAPGLLRSELPPHGRLRHRAPRPGHLGRGAEPAGRGRRCATCCRRWAPLVTAAARGVRRRSGGRARRRCAWPPSAPGTDPAALAGLVGGARPGGAGGPGRRPRAARPPAARPARVRRVLRVGRRSAGRGDRRAATGSWCPPCPTTCWPGTTPTCGAGCCAARACRSRCWPRTPPTSGRTERRPARQPVDQVAARAGAAAARGERSRCGRELGGARCPPARRRTSTREPERSPSSAYRSGDDPHPPSHRAADDRPGRPTASVTPPAAPIPAAAGGARLPGSRTERLSDASVAACGRRPTVAAQHRPRAEHGDHDAGPDAASRSSAAEDEADGDGHPPSLMAVWANPLVGPSVRRRYPGDVARRLTDTTAP